MVTSSITITAAMVGAAILAITSASVQGQPNPQATPKTVLDGVFTAAQADRGAAIYEAECAVCHEGADVDGPPLTGAPFIDRWREDTLAGLFEFIKTRMPQSKPGSLSDAAYLDIVGHMLQASAYAAGSRELTMDALTTTLLVGPDGPRPLPNGALVRVVGCLTRGPSQDWIVTRAQRPSRVRDGNHITAAEATAAKGAGLGTQTFALQNVGEGGTALSGAAEGQMVFVKGALTQRADVVRIHVTAAASLDATCS